MEPEGSLQCLQASASWFCPDPDESSPRPQTLFLCDVLVLSSHLHLILPFKFSD
jgi:hypothetical protein